MPIAPDALVFSLLLVGLALAGTVVAYRAIRRPLDESRRWRRVLETLPQMILTASPDGRFDYLSPQSLAYTGYAEEALLGRGWLERIIHPDDRVKSRADWMTSVQTGADFRAEHRLRRHDGEYRWFSCHARPVRERDRIVGWTGLCVDITDERESEEESRRVQNHDITRIKNAEEAARRAEEQLRLATRLSGVYVWSFDLTSGDLGAARATFVNVLESLGYDENEFPAQFASSLALVLDSEDQARVFGDVQACIEGKVEQLESEYRIRHKDGSLHWNLARGLVLRDPDGRPLSFTGTSVDITYLKEIEHEARKTKERLELAVLGSRACTWDFEMDDGRIESARATYNNVWELLGYDPAKDATRFAGGPAWLIRPEDQAQFVADLQSFFNGTAREWEREVRLLHRDGTDRWQLTRGVAARDEQGRVVRFTGAGVDITDRRYMEAELSRAREAAEAANRAKDEFLANVSHEIRTPMNAILGMTELALDAAPNDHQRQLLATVQSAAKNLLTIINDLLDFSKIAAGKLMLDDADFSLRAAVGDTLRALAVRAHRKGIEILCQIHPDVPDTLRGDAGRLRQVLMNLVGNAIKFTARGEVGVSVETAEDGSNGHVTLRFCVRDTGIGIAPDKQAAIFRAFEQGDSSTTRKYGGTGLGLTISAQLAALMGGAITVESEVARGSTFAFSARFARSPPAEARARSPERVAMSSDVATADAGSLRVLVAEDNDLNVALLQELLRHRGHQAQFARDGRAALELASQGACDLMLLDLHMPELDGFEVVQAIRGQERTSARHLPIIALTARSSARDRERCLAAGMDDFLSKPIEASALWNAMDRLVERWGNRWPPARPAARSAPPTLLDARAVLRACGGRASVLETLRVTFRRTLPNQWAGVRTALDERDLPRLRDAAHQLVGTLGMFSTVAADVASTLEDAAIREEPEICAALVERLASMCDTLLDVTVGLSLDSLAL